MTPEQRAEQIASCKRDEATAAAEGGGGVTDFGCDRMFAIPSPSDYGLVSTSNEAIVRSIVVQGVYVFGFLAFILGASFVAAEFATGSMGTWLTFQPRRLRVASAKLCAAAIGGLAVGAVAVVLGLLSAAMISTVNRPGAELPLAETTATGSLWQELARALAAIALGGLGGAVIGFLLRSTAGVIGAVLGWVVVVEGLVGIDPRRGAPPAVARAHQPRRLRQRRRVLHGHDLRHRRLPDGSGGTVLHARLGLPARRHHCGRGRPRCSLFRRRDVT